MRIIPPLESPCINEGESELILELEGCPDLSGTALVVDRMPEGAIAPDITSIGNKRYRVKVFSPGAYLFSGKCCPLP